jgi:ubiquinone biosynthesis protein
MVCTVDNEVRWHLANALKAILDRNADMLIDALIELGAVSLRVEGSRALLRKDMKYVMGQFSTTHLLKRSESVSYNLEQLFTMLRRNHIQLPSNTFLLLKTIVMAQSLGRGLDPEFDIAPLLQSSVLRAIRKRYSIAAALRRVPVQTAEFASLVGGLPQRFDRMLKTAERGEMQVRADVSGIDTYVRHVEKLVNRAVIYILGASIIIGLALFFVGTRLGH